MLTASPNEGRRPSVSHTAVMTSKTPPVGSILASCISLLTSKAALKMASGRANNGAMSVQATDRISKTWTCLPPAHACTSRTRDRYGSSARPAAPSRGCLSGDVSVLVELDRDRLLKFRQDLGFHIHANDIWGASDDLGHRLPGFSG